MTSWAGPQTLDSQPAGVVEQVIGDQRVRESHTLAVSHTSHTSHTGMCESGAIEVIKSKNSWVSHTSRKVLWNAWIQGNRSELWENLSGNLLNTQSVTDKLEAKSHAIFQEGIDGMLSNHPMQWWWCDGYTLIQLVWCVLQMLEIIYDRFWRKHEKQSYKRNKIIIQKNVCYNQHRNCQQGNTWALQSLLLFSKWMQLFKNRFSRDREWFLFYTALVLVIVNHSTATGQNQHHNLVARNTTLYFNIVNTCCSHFYDLSTG